MTKREICERLLTIYAEDWRAVRVKKLLLDIAAPDDHFADAGKKGAPLPDISVAAPEEEKPEREEEKHPGVIAKPGKDGEIEWCWCQKCYAKADVVRDPFGDGENWSYCPKCGVSFRLKRGEEGK